MDRELFKYENDIRPRYVKFAEPVMTVQLPSHALTGKTRLPYTLDNSSVSKAANLRCHMCVPIAMAWSVCQQAWTTTDAFAPSAQLVNILLSCKDIYILFIYILYTSNDHYTWV